ncbi:hypothetical protein CLAIMM_11222 isoform 1, partial [Cladophialophora immunda]
MVRKNSKHPRPFLEEAGPFSQPELHAASDSPQSLDSEPVSSRTGSPSPYISEDIRQAPQQKPDSAIPAQSGAGSPSKAIPASAERAQRIQREQISHQVHRTLDLISMVCWGDVETAVTVLRRSYILALDRIDRGDRSVLLFRPSDPDFVLWDNRHTSFAEDYEDWVLPLRLHNVGAH